MVKRSLLDKAIQTPVQVFKYKALESPVSKRCVKPHYVALVNVQLLQFIESCYLWKHVFI